MSTRRALALNSSGVSYVMFGLPFSTRAQASTPREISTASTCAASLAIAAARYPGPHP